MTDLKFITYDDLQELKQEILDAIHEELQTSSTSCNPNDYLTADEVKKMLGISSKQFQLMRQRHQLTHYVVGRKIYVKRRDLDAFIEEYKIESNY